VKEGRALFPPITTTKKQKKMTTHIEIDVSIYRADRYEQLERQGRIKLSSNIETIEEGSLTKEYERLKKAADILIADINARTRLAAEVSELEDQIRWKGHQLADIKKDIEKATEHYETLKLFLQNLGVNPKHSRLTFDKQLLLSQTASELKVSATEQYPGSEF
jgi:mRNA-degrading endonuclease toxin of MazEF toxin-antitoxin module